MSRVAEILPTLSDQPDRLHTVPEVAKLTGVTTHTVRAWIRSGDMDALKLNGYWRIPHSALMRYLEQRFG